MKKITFNLSLNSKKIILKLFLILFLSIIFSFKAFSLPQVLILKNSFNSGGYTYHVFDVYDGQIYRGIRITYTGPNGEGGLWRNYYHWKRIFQNIIENEKNFSEIDIKILISNDNLTLRKNRIYNNDLFVQVLNYNGKQLSITVSISAADEHNIYNLNLPSGIYFINLFCQNDRQVIKFIQN